MHIGFIGAGKVGTALGLYFRQHGLPVTGYCSRTLASAQEAAALTGTEAFADMTALVRVCDVIFLTVPDQMLEPLSSSAAALFDGKAALPARCWIHVSGALPSSCLSRLQALGCPVGSMHPLQSFGAPLDSAARLNQAVFSIEGTEEALDIMAGILDKAGARISRISTKQKPLYHAGACVVSNYLVTLLDCGIRYFEAAGMDRSTVLDAISPLIDATLANIRQRDTVDALTGPIVRGDLNTLRIHLDALEQQLPSELEFYKTMAEKTIQMIAGQRISTRQQRELQEILEGNIRYEQ